MAEYLGKYAVRAARKTLAEAEEIAADKELYTLVLSNAYAPITEPEPEPEPEPEDEDEDEDEDEG